MVDVWNEFKARFPHADLSRFKREKFFDEDNVMFVDPSGDETAVFDGGRFTPSLYYSTSMKQALGIFSSFPLAIQLNPKPKLKVPAVQFTSTAHEIGDQLVNHNIYITESDSFNIKFRDVFTKLKIAHRSAKESKRWLAAPSLRYWPQQLNFAFWCATTGCGISSRLLFEDKMADGIHDVRDDALHLPKQVRSFLWFHVYFTVRRILFQLGGIQNILALPDDPTFSQTDNKYDEASYKRLCNEFGISPSTDFRYRRGMNHGLGSVFIWYTGSGVEKTNFNWPDYFKFSDEGGKGLSGNLLTYIENVTADKQYEYFLAADGDGLTSTGQSRINQSIEAFVYCILGAQVNARSSILGSGGSAQEVRHEFLTLLEDAVRQPDISKSIQRFQLAVQEAKVKLDLAISPGCWLLPSNMVINTESVTGYNNKLKKATTGMKLGVNSEVNMIMKPVGIKHNMSSSKVKLPHASTGEVKPDVHTPKETKPDVSKPVIEKPMTSQHETNLIALTVVVGGLAWFLLR